ncbi:MAG: tetratricopeptide repeat protein [Pyrinomonadaceae bacterium]
MLNPTLRALGLVVLGLCAAVATVAQFPTGAQPVEITGQVRYTNGSPAFDVVVRLEQQSGGYIGEVRTDRLGKFQFRSLVPQQYRLSIRHPGYKEIEREVNLVMQFSDYVQLALVADNPAAPTTRTGNADGLLLNASVPLAARQEFDAGRLAVQDSKKLDEGLQHLEQAVKLYPNYLEAQLLLGTVYMEERHWEQAEAALRAALRINPKTAPAYFALGEVYRRQKKHAEAEKELLEGLKLDDKSVQGHFTLGRVYFEQGDIVRAGPHVGKALQLDPKLAEGHLLAGNILLKARQPNNALAEFQAYLILAPDGEFAPQARALVDKLKQATANKKPQ